MKLSLQLKLGQQLTMTPQLQQAIKRLGSDVPLRIELSKRARATAAARHDAAVVRADFQAALTDAAVGSGCVELPSP